ncbi:MAG TPA: DUF3253 domain-containing protein [Dermatophilaceae bacterium]|nr:DUF3253 domain-containing protein [Dermatophilaceae bacterium]
MANTQDGPRPAPDEKALRAGVLDLLAQRDPDKTICPSEVARQLGGTSWRELMSPVRDAAERLVREGLVEIVQGGAPVDLRAARGPVRLRRGPSWPAQSGARAQWLLPVDPAAHPEHQPADWTAKYAATACAEKL